MDVLKAWDYAQTIFRTEKLQIAYPKAEIDTNKWRKSPKQVPNKCRQLISMCHIHIY